MTILELLQDHMYVVVVGLLALTMLINSMIRAITTVLTTQAREQSRREIAAYVAEGSITPVEGERLVKADVNSEARRQM